MNASLLHDVAVSQPTTKRWGSTWPLLTSIFLLGTLCAVEIFFTLKLCAGHFIYALDDAYIGAAMAKNLALHGVLGVTRHTFASAASCPFWILLLSAAYKVFGVSEWAPVALSLAFALLTLVVADRVLLGHLSARMRAGALVSVVLFTPSHVLASIGMEHSLHVLLTLAFLRFSMDLVVDHRWSPWLWPLVPIMVMVRYESMFLVAPVFMLLAFQKRWKRALELGALAWLPVVAYGAFSLSKGWYWLPNSIAMKGASGSHLFIHLAWVCVKGPHLIVVVIALAILAYVCRTDRRATFLLSVVLVAGCLHLLLAGVGWSYRYEDYLLAAAVAASAVAFPTFKKATATEPALALVLLSPAIILVGRCAIATIRLPENSRAIYSQQYQMAKFIHRYFDSGAIAANDIGAINFFNDLTCVDLTGLADREIFFAKRSHSYTTSVISRETQAAHVEIAMVYDDWFSGKPSPFPGPPLPEQWKRVARWRTPYKGELGSDTVSFYAVLPSAVDKLRRSLREFPGSLPRGVIVVPN